MSEFVLVNGGREDDEPEAQPKRRTKRTPVPLPGVASLRQIHDPLLGPCLAAFGVTPRGHASPFIARVLGVGPEGGPRYRIEFLGRWLTCDALGVRAGAGFTGASVVAVEALRNLDCLDIRHGQVVLGPWAKERSGGGTRGYYLWLATSGLEPLTERELRQALASRWRAGLVGAVPPPPGRAVKIGAQP